MSGVRWVGQKHRYGCQVATAAMLMGIEYDEAKRLLTIDLDLDENALSYFALDSQLASQGYAIGRRYQIMQPGNQKRDQWPCEPWAAVHWCEVMTSEAARYAHAVVMLADGTVLDPATPEPKRLADYPKVNFIAAVVPVTPTPVEPEEETRA